MIETITRADLQSLARSAADAPRRRAHLNVHKSLDAAVQRLFIATEPDTYMRPHRHPQAHKWEFFMVLSGELDLLTFDEQGQVVERISLSPASTPAVEVPPGTWHCYVCRQSGTLALEVKEGAYIPTAEADFAPWAPPENSADASAYLDWLREARPVS